jgi:hypothetical protein
MAPIVTPSAHSAALPAPRWRRPALRVVRAAEPQSDTRALLLKGWRRALDAAAAAVDSAFDQNSLAGEALRETRRRLRWEQEWLVRFERETAARFP